MNAAQVTHPPGLELAEREINKLREDRAVLIEFANFVIRNNASSRGYKSLCDEFKYQARAAIAKATAKPSSYLQAEQWPDAHNQQQAASLGPK